jgi:hypothetical protein
VENSCTNVISVDSDVDKEGAYIDISAWTEKHGVSRDAYKELRSILLRYHGVDKQGHLFQRHNSSENKYNLFI